MAEGSGARVIAADFGAQKQVPNRLTVRSDGMMVVRHEDLRQKTVLLDFPPTVVPSIVGSARGFNADGTELKVNVRTTSTSERPQQKSGTAPTPLLESLVGQDAKVQTPTGELSGRVVGFTVAGQDLMAVLETKGEGADVSTATLVSLRDSRISVTMGGKTKELAPQRQSVALDADDSELSAVEYIMPGTKWGVLYRLHLSEGKAMLDTSIFWENPFDRPISVSVTFENSASYSCQPDLNLAADPLSSVRLGDRARAAPHVERTISHVRRVEVAEMAPSASPRGGAARRMAVAAAGAVALPAFAVGAALRGTGPAEVNELMVMEELDGGFQVSSGAIPIVSYSPKDAVKAGANEKVTIPIGTRESFEGRLLLIADIDYVDARPTETVPIECARFKSGKQQLLQGQATVYHEGRQVGSTELEFTRPFSDVTLAVREAREFSVMAHQTRGNETVSKELVRTEDGRCATRTTYSRSRTVEYMINNTGKGAREVLIGHAQATTDSKLTFVEGESLVHAKRQEKTKNGTRFSVLATTEITKIVVKEEWQEAQVQYIGRFANWWHRNAELPRVKSR